MQPTVDYSRPWDSYSLPRFTHPFRSRPDIGVPYLNVTTNEADRVAPGYLFLSPFGSEHSGPLIYDQHGSLVWHGSDAYDSEVNNGPHVFNFYPCHYREGDGLDDKVADHTSLPRMHICLNRGIQDTGMSRGEGLILGPDYQVVRGAHYNGSSTAIDIHEFSLVANGSAAIITQYRPAPADLTAHGMPGIGFVYNSLFQEQRLSDGAVLFEWRSLDHVGLHESNVSFYGGLGHDPWDYMHLNSVQKTDDGSGDYLLCARHTSAIYRISGADGSVRWRLGGTNSDFRLVSDEESSRSSTSPPGPESDGLARWFHFPHDAALLRSSGGVDTISLFDNGRTQHQVLDAPLSRGLVMEVDTNRRTARIITEYLTPGNPKQAVLGGSMRALPGGNVLVGWGKTGCLSEYGAAAQEPVFEACLLDHTNKGSPALYRVHKSDRWVGRPSGRPAVMAYSRARNRTAVYASWNGATEIAGWRIYGSVGATTAGTGSAARGRPSEAETRWEEVAVEPRAGFETLAGPFPSFFPFVYAEALDAEGRVLGVSDSTPTTVPRDAHDGCDDLWCSALIMVDDGDGDPAAKGTILSLALDSYRWLYPSVFLYAVVAICLGVVVLRQCVGTAAVCSLWMSTIE